MRDVFIFGSGKVNVIFNVGEAALVAGRDNCAEDWTEDQIREWVEANPFEPMRLAMETIKASQQYLDQNGVIIKLDDNPDFCYDDQIFQNYNGFAISSPCPKDVEDRIFDIHQAVFINGIEPKLTEFFKNK